MSYEVELTIPADPAFLRLVRLAAADAASRAGLTIEEIDDLRIAVDELCLLLVRGALEPDVDIPHDEVTRLSVSFVTMAGAVEVRARGGRPDHGGWGEAEQEISRAIVKAVVDEYEILDDAAVGGFWLLKRATRAQT